MPELNEETATIDQTIQQESELSNTTSNEDVGLNETTVSTPESSVLEFTLYSTNEDYIVNEVAYVTGLNLGQVKKLINFVYKDPVNFEDEIIEPQVFGFGWIEKINGTVRIKLG